MGEYEDRYPEAYGRTEDLARPAAAESDAVSRPRQSRERLAATQPPQHVARQNRERPLLERLGLRSPPARLWQHAPTTAAPPPTPAAPAMPAPSPVAPEAASAPAIRSAIPPATQTEPPVSPGLFRGRGPRGYVRSAERIREDLCDRLTENPFVDASDIEVAVAGSEVTLSGTVDSATAYNQAQQIAEEVIGISRINNRLAIRDHVDAGPTAGDAVNRAMPPPRV